MKNLLHFAKVNQRKWYANLAFSLLVLSPFATAQDCNSPHWVAAWQSAPADAIFLSPRVGDYDFLSLGKNQTFREIFSPLGGGSTLRLHFSNRFGKQSLQIKAISVAKQTEGAAIDASTLKPVLFNGQSSITIPAYQDRVSDAVSFDFNSFDKLSVSIAVIDAGGFPTEHYNAQEFSFVTKPNTGNHVNDVNGSAFSQKTTRRHMLIGMDAIASAATSVVVTLGDSITDGTNINASSIGENSRYPDFLKRRIDSAGLPLFVANAGIAGNRVVGGNLFITGPAATERYLKDVLQKNGVSDVILLEGINDIGMDFYKFLDYSYRYQQIINGYKTLITGMQRQGIKVTQGTLTPASKAPVFSYSTPFALQLRQDINWWIRNKSPANVIVDFDAAVRDSSNPELINTLYDSGDGLHFNAAGYAKMAAAIDLSKLQGSVCR